MDSNLKPYDACLLRQLEQANSMVPYMLPHDLGLLSSLIPFRRESQYVVQVDLELLCPSNPTSASPVAGVTGMCGHSQDMVRFSPL